MISDLAANQRKLKSHLSVKQVPVAELLELEIFTKAI